MDPLLRIRNLSVAVGGPTGERVVLHQVDLDLHPGKVTALLGPSGSGKSTLAAVLLGIHPLGQYRVLQGTAEWREYREWLDLLTQDPRTRSTWWGKRMGLIAQEPGQALNPVMTVGAQLAEICPDHAGQSAMRDRLHELGLDPDKTWNSYPWELSGGQQQRVLLAMTLFPQPALILADEPTAALDRHHQLAFLDILRRQLVRTDPPALLLITHDRRIAAHIADEVVVLEDGRIIRKGPPGEVLAAHHPMERAMGPQLTEQASADRPALSLRDLRGGYRKGREVVNLDRLDLRQGQLLGLAGPSGCGKSSLLRAILGLLPWQQGEVFSFGESPDPEARGRLFPLIHQDPGRSFNPAMTIEQALEEIRRAGSKPMREAQSLLARLELPHDTLQRRPHQFSGGQKQRLAIVRALLGSPRVLLCDEPFSSLDAPMQRHFLDLLRRLCREEGIAALVVAHDLPLLLEYCDQVAIMDQGRIHGVDSPPGWSAGNDPLFRSLQE